MTHNLYESYNSSELLIYLLIAYVLHFVFHACNVCQRNAIDKILVEVGRHGSVAQWIRRLPTEQEIVGSSPA